MVTNSQRAEISKLQGEIGAKYSGNRARERLRELADSLRRNKNISRSEYKELVGQSMSPDAIARRNRENIVNQPSAPGNLSHIESGGRVFAGKTVNFAGDRTFIGVRSVGKGEQLAREKNKAVLRGIQESRERLRPVGMSAEEFRVRQGTATSKDRASFLSEQIETKRAVAPFTPVSVATLSPFQTKALNIKNITTKKGIQNDNTSFGELRAGDSSNNSTSQVVQDETGREKRIKALLERENSLTAYKEGVFEELGIKKTPEEEQIRLFSLTSAKETSKGLFKSAIQAPIDIISMGPIYGGRAAFAAESLTFSEGQKELKRAFVKTPGEAIKGFDPKTTSGLFNIGLTTLAVKGAGKTLSAKTDLAFEAYPKSGGQGVTFVGEGLLKGEPVKAVISSTEGKSTLFAQLKSGKVLKATSEGNLLELKSKVTPIDRSFVAVQETGLRTRAVTNELFNIKSSGAGKIGKANVELDLAYSDLFRRKVTASPEVTEVFDISSPTGNSKPQKTIRSVDITPPELTFEPGPIASDALSIEPIKRGARVTQTLQPQVQEIGVFRRTGTGRLRISEPSILERFEVKVPKMGKKGSALLSESKARQSFVRLKPSEPSVLKSFSIPRLSQKGSVLPFASPKTFTNPKASIGQSSKQAFKDRQALIGSTGFKVRSDASPLLSAKPFAKVSQKANPLTDLKINQANRVMSRTTPGLVSPSAPFAPNLPKMPPYRPSGFPRMKVPELNLIEQTRKYASKKINIPLGATPTFTNALLGLKTRKYKEGTVFSGLENR